MGRSFHLVRGVAACAALILLAACSGGSGGSGGSSSSSPSAAPAHTALPAGAKTPVTFEFSDVAIATAGSNALRLGFSISNQSTDPQLCDASEFFVQLDDGTVVASDDAAENTCDPSTVDPNGSGKSTIYFDLPHQYTGGITLFMVSNDKVVGQGTTTLK